MNDAQLFGVRIADLVAGFFGGMIALSYLPTMSRTRMLITISVGVVAAAYGGPALADHFKLTRPLESVASLFLGMTAMQYGVPAVMSFSSMLYQKPEQWLKKFIDKEDQQ